MLSQTAVLGLLAAASVCWPRARAVTRLERVIRSAEADRPKGEATRDSHIPQLPRLPRSHRLQIPLGVGATLVMSQFWALPVCLTALAVGTTACRAVIRGRRDRAVMAEDQAALDGLGVLTAELRAGRAPDEALAIASRHSDNLAVSGFLGWLSRSIRLGGQLAKSLNTDSSSWRARLIAGLRLSAQTGCALADVIAAVESDLAGLIDRRADLRASAAGHRATVALLACLPILGLAMGSGIGAEPVRILTATTLGNVLLLAGLALELLGLTWSRRLTARALREG